MVQVAPEHKGVSILINRDYRPTFGDLESLKLQEVFGQKKW